MSDIGLFGPESETWRVFTLPSASVGLQAALLAQSLYPRVMRLFEQASGYRKNPDLRAKLTIEFATTITYGNTEAAENAGATLVHLHSLMRATDVETGEPYDANDPPLLMWVHNTTVWGMLRGLERWGPRLSPEQADRFVDEQRIAARLVGLDPASVPATVAALNDYIAEVTPRLANTMQAVALNSFNETFRRPLTPAWFVSKIAMLGGYSLLTDEMRALYGIRWGPLHEAWASFCVRGLVALVRKRDALPKVFADMQALAIEHRFGRPRPAAKAAS